MCKTEVDNRLKSTGGASGAMSKCISDRSRPLSLHAIYDAKQVVYNGLVLAVLLYGAETWSPTEVLFGRLRAFHVRCVRTMCLVSKRRMWKEHSSTAELENQLGMQSIGVHVYRRQLAWAGQVSRMGFGS